MNFRNYGLGPSHGESLGAALKVSLYILVEPRRPCAVLQTSPALSDPQHMPTSIKRLDLSHNGLADLPAAALLANLKDSRTLVRRIAHASS
jgi:hypothetical protein